MKKLLLVILATFMTLSTPLTYAAAATSGSAGGISGAACKGKFFNPVSDPDWNDVFPITVMGQKIGPNSDPPLMYEPPVCTCPGILGVPTPGIGVTFWQPLYVSEIARTPGCLSSLGGVNVLPGYAMEQSESNSANARKDRTTRRQVHWYEYPLFAMMDLFTSFSCFKMQGFDLAYLTEVDPTWQDDLWGAVFAPEAALFSNPLTQAACSVDAVAASTGFPLDDLFWCAGTWGSVYPLTGNSPTANSPFQTNNLVQAKFIARQSRLGLQWQTIGPSAQCFAHPNPIWIKSMYRVDQVGPIVRRGSPMVIGSPGLKQSPEQSNYPSREDTVNLIWQGQQCCLRLF